MSKLISVLIVLLATNVFAAPAKTYQCGGLETISNNIYAVNAEINYSDWKMDKGYTTETITLSYPVGKVVKPGSTTNLQELRDVANANDCATLTEMEVIQSPNPDYAYLKFEFIFTCNNVSQAIYKLEVYCDK